MGEMGPVPSVAGMNCLSCWVASGFRKNFGETLYVEYHLVLYPFEICHQNDCEVIFLNRLASLACASCCNCNLTKLIKKHEPKPQSVEILLRGPRWVSIKSRLEPSDIQQLKDLPTLPLEDRSAESSSSLAVHGVGHYISPPLGASFQSLITIAKLPMMILKQNPLGTLLLPASSIPGVGFPVTTRPSIAQTSPYSAEALPFIKEKAIT